MTSQPPDAQLGMVKDRKVKTQDSRTLQSTPDWHLEASPEVFGMDESKVGIPTQWVKPVGLYPPKLVYG